MTALRGGATELRPLLPPTLIGASLGALSIAVVAGTAVKPALALTLSAVVMVTWRRTLFTWRSMIALIIGVILFIPIRRYALPGGLPFQLEPYRVLIGLVTIAWIAALLADRRVRFPRTLIDGPLALAFVVSAASIAANASTISNLHVTSAAIKQLTFLASFLLVFWLIVGLMRKPEDIDKMTRILVGGAAVLGVFALVELWTKYNVFNHIDRVFPFLHATAAPVEQIRQGHIRVLASSQHPIALGALFAMLIPMAIYLIRHTGQRRWWAATAVFALAALGTGSRTAVVMLFVIAIVYLVLRRRETIRLWPALIPMVIMIHLAIPGAIGGFYKAFFPKGGLVAEQGGAPVGSSRVASLGPGLHVIGLHPLLGAGYGARVFQGPDRNSFIVDDQWLSTGMETGLLGIAAWAWVFVRFLRSTFRASKQDDSPRGWMFTGIAAAVTAYAVGMFTYDAYSFIQTTFVLFFLLGLGCAALAARDRPELRA